MGYKMYRSVTKNLVKLLGKPTSMAPRDRPYALMDSELVKTGMITQALQAEADLGDTFIKQVTQEGAWIDDGRPTIFIPDIAFAERLIRARVSAQRIVAPDSLQTFAIAVPAGWVHRGVEMEPALVTIGCEGDFIDWREDAAARRWRVKTAFATDGDDEDLVVMFTCVAKDQTDSAGRPLDRTAGALCMNTVLDCGMLQALTASPEDVSRDQLRFSERQTDDFMATEEEGRYIAWMSRLIVNLWVYTRAVEGALVPGLPGKVQDGDVPVFGKARGYYLKDASPEIGRGRSVAEHYRSWHFRQLNDERFYRGEHKDREPGSRWTFVSESVVGSVAAQTVSEAPQELYPVDFSPGM